MRIDAPLRARDGVVDRAFRAWPIQFLPGGGDEAGKPPTLLGSGRQAAAGRGSPDPDRGGAENLVPSANRQPEPVQRPAETLEQECAASGVVAEQPHASPAVGEPQDRDLVLGRVAATRHEQFQYRRSAVFADRFRDESFGRVGVGGADRDTPVQLHPCDQLRQIVEPSFRTDGERLLTDDFGKLDHESQCHETPAG